MHTYLHLCISVYPFIQLCACVHLCLCKCTRVSTCACASVCASMCAHPCACLCIHVCVSMSVYPCVCIHVHLHTRVRVHVHVRVPVCVSPCARPCVCVCSAGGSLGRFIDALVFLRRYRALDDITQILKPHVLAGPAGRCPAPGHAQLQAMPSSGPCPAPCSPLPRPTPGQSWDERDPLRQPEPSRRGEGTPTRG